MPKFKVLLFVLVVKWAFDCGWIEAQQSVHMLGAIPNSLSKSEVQNIVAKQEQVVDSVFIVDYKNTQVDSRQKVLIWLGAIVGFDLLILIIYLYRKRQRNIEKKKIERVENSKALVVSGFVATDSLRLFGAFVLLDKQGRDLSDSFSPLLKEIFLMVVVHSVVKDKPIEGIDLAGRLWPGMNEKNARNNMAVNYGKMKALLGSDYPQFVRYEAGRWYADFSSTDLICDLKKSLSIVNQGLHSENELVELLTYLQGGSLLSLHNYTWLDEYKEVVSHQVIDVLIGYANTVPSLSASMLIQLADTVFLFDMLNEQAMEIKCQSLVTLGKHSMARNAYTKFVGEYFELYNKEYDRSFNAIIRF